MTPKHITDRLNTAARKAGFDGVFTVTHGGEVGTSRLVQSSYQISIEMDRHEDGDGSEVDEQLERAGAWIVACLSREGIAAHVVDLGLVAYGPTYSPRPTAWATRPY